MADKARCVSQGIVENVLVKIDKFSFTSDFVIIDTKELNNKNIILGSPFLTNIHADINISTREVSLGIKEDRVKIKMKEQECNTTIDEHLNTRPTSQAGISRGAINKTHWCESARQKHEKGYTLWDNKLRGQIREKILTEEQEDPEKCGETKERAIIGAMWKDDVCTKWSSCNPHFDECDGGDNPRENKEYWESSNDDIRTTLEWESLSFDNWVRVAFGKKLGGNYRDRLDSYSFGNLAEIAAVAV
ncbi:zinc knuckle CX2CX4HX4C containing protein [Tanacetum coccineum]